MPHIFPMSSGNKLLLIHNAEGTEGILRTDISSSYRKKTFFIIGNFAEKRKGGIGFSPRARFTYKPHGRSEVTKRRTVYTVSITELN